MQVISFLSVQGGDCPVSPRAPNHSSSLPPPQCTINWKHPYLEPVYLPLSAADQGSIRDPLGVRERREEVDDTRREEDLRGSVDDSGCRRGANAMKTCWGVEARGLETESEDIYLTVPSLFDGGAWLRKLREIGGSPSRKKKGAKMGKR